MQISVKTETGRSHGFVLTFFLDYIRERPIASVRSVAVTDLFFII